MDELEPRLLGMLNVARMQVFSLWSSWWLRNCPWISWLWVVGIFPIDCSCIYEELWTIAQHLKDHCEMSKSKDLITSVKFFSDPETTRRRGGAVQCRGWLMIIITILKIILIYRFPPSYWYRYLYQVAPFNCQQLIQDRFTHTNCVKCSLYHASQHCGG